MKKIKWMLLPGVIWLAISIAMLAVTIYIYHNYPKAVIWVFVFNSLSSGIVITVAAGVLWDRIIYQRIKKKK